jgi:hypothetical protein
VNKLVETVGDMDGVMGFEVSGISIHGGIYG